jgi:hypothetical protein
MKFYSNKTGRFGSSQHDTAEGNPANNEKQRMYAQVGIIHILHYTSKLTRHVWSHRVYLLCPSSNILREHNVLETRSVSVLRRKGADQNSGARKGRVNVNHHCTIEVSQTRKGVIKKNSVVLSPLANYTDRAIAAGQRS